MADLIDASVLVKAMKNRLKSYEKEYGYLSDFVSGYEEAIDDITDAPTIEAKPVVHAHWEYLGVSNGKKIYKCTNCEAHIHGTGNFCKECGAIMDEKEGE